MKIAVAGTGYVGLVTGVCLADKGHTVVCVDVDEKKVAVMQAGKSPIFEPGLEELMQKNAARLTYTLDYKSAYAGADVIFIGVGTPEKKDGSAELKYVYAVAQNIKESLTGPVVVVIKSTVPVGTNQKLRALFKDSPYTVDVVSNPEFLAQGTAVRDTMFPSRIIIGVDTPHAAKIMQKVYEDYDAPKLVMNNNSAEMVKYASNDFLALKISYINEIANLCEIVGADVHDVTEGMGLDTRIGSKFLRAGIGYGGSCFPKDTKALHWLANMHDYELKTIKAAIEVNENQKLKLLKKARKYYESFSGLTVAILGVTFKPDTDDLREAPSLVNIPILLEDGAKIQAYDPIGQVTFSRMYPDVVFFDSIENALKGADICFIFTEWKEIVACTPETFVKNMRRAIVLDGRNCYNPSEMRQAGIQYESIGRLNL